MSDAQKATAATAILQHLEANDLSSALATLEAPASAPPLATETPSAAAFDALFAALKQFGDRATALDEQIREVEAELEMHLLWLPNLPHASTPVGASDADNIAHPAQGAFRPFDFTPLPHWELGPQLDLIDFERGVKLAGSRFYLLKHQGARLLRALINWMLDEHATAGFQEIYVPYLVKAEALYGAAQFPKFREVVYFDAESELYMLPTSEVALTNIFRDEILEESDLPLYLMSHTPCFRREKMSAGRDVRGIKRGHQFEKVEMYKFTTPETSYDELESLTRQAEQVCARLEIPYRRLEIVTGDLGFAATKKYDLEMYAPGCDEWLEVSSCSNTEDFQARRANLRYRPSDGGKPRYVHTLNGSGLGMSRVLIAVMENYQQADGSVRVPAVLVPYMGGLQVIEPR
ncbi:MAG: serine--tRNA ligase [Anaerolineae bacterium]|nr:serine--tRNA ligase [Anaerolineae bacterium]